MNTELCSPYVAYGGLRRNVHLSSETAGDSVSGLPDGNGGDVEGSESRRGLKTSTMTNPKMIKRSKNMQLRLPVFFWYL